MTSEQRSDTHILFSGHLRTEYAEPVESNSESVARFLVVSSLRCGIEKSHLDRAVL